jgi:hypothetical protein
MARTQVPKVKLTTSQTWAIIALAGLWIFGDVAVAFRTAGITAASIDAFFMDLSQGQVIGAIGAAATGTGGFFAGKFRQRKLIEKLPTMTSFGPVLEVDK